MALSGAGVERKTGTRLLYVRNNKVNGSDLMDTFNLESSDIWSYRVISLLQ